MNEEIKEKICKIIMKEYRKHNQQVCEKHLNSGYFLHSWSQKMENLGIKMFEGIDAEVGYTVVRTGLVMGNIQIPEETAEKILVLGGFP